MDDGTQVKSCDGLPGSPSPNHSKRGRGSAEEERIVARSEAIELEGCTGV